MIRPCFGLPYDISEPENTKSTIKLFPNPTKDKLSINSEYIISNIEIFDIYGRKVFETKETNTEIDVSNLNKGIYFMRITDSSDKTTIKKFVVQK